MWNSSLWSHSSRSSWIYSFMSVCVHGHLHVDCKHSPRMMQHPTSNIILELHDILCIVTNANTCRILFLAPLEGTLSISSSMWISIKQEWLQIGHYHTLECSDMILWFVLPTTDQCAFARLTRPLFCAHRLGWGLSFYISITLVVLNPIPYIVSNEYYVLKQLVWCPHACHALYTPLTL